MSALAGLMLNSFMVGYLHDLFDYYYLAGLQIGLYDECEEMFADEDDNKECDCVSGPAGGGEARSSLKGESLTPDRGEGEGDAVILAGVGDLESLGLLSLGLSPLELCCCFACCRHLARRFLNQT